MQLPQITEIKGIRVLTTRQLTEEYQTEEWQIKQNFRNNKGRFIQGKHYITLQGAELKEFKSKVENFYLVGKTAKILYLWTEKGALLHAKSLNTDKAWEVYDYLVDHYFRSEEVIKGIQRQQSVPDIKPYKNMVANIPENPEAQKLIRDMRKYLTGMDALMDAFNTYQSEENYKHIIGAISALEGKIVRTAMMMTMIKPKMVEKNL